MPLDMSEHFTTGRLLRYTAPSIAMVVFASIYSIVDGLFVSNFAGTASFAALNFVMPILLILGTLGFMFGTGGSAIVAKTRGEGDDERANRYFTLLICSAAVAGAGFAVLGMFIVEPACTAMGADSEMIPLCVMYGRIICIAMPAFVLQYAFQSFFMTAGKPILGFAFTVIAGVTNIILDAVFVAGLGMGLFGAAVASAIGMAIGGFAPIVYFVRPNSSCLRMCHTKLEWKVLAKACVNGMSEMVGNLAMAVVGIVYNVQLINMLGQYGVSAYGVIMYVGMIFAGVYMGFSVGAAPLMSFQYGAANHKEMQSLYRKCMTIVGVFGVLMLAASEGLAGTLAQLFVGYDPELCSLTAYALSLYALAFLVMGFNVYGSSLFTSLNNGVVSAIISFVRSFIFEIGSVLILPMLFGAGAIWLSICVAESASLIMTLSFMLALGRRYGFLKPKKHESLEQGRQS